VQKYSKTFIQGKVSVTIQSMSDKKEMEEPGIITTEEALEPFFS
jgi:hypothetical protein